MTQEAISHVTPVYPRPQYPAIQKLSEREFDVLGAIQFHARKPVSVIARELGMKDHVVRYALSRLREREIIHFAPLIDTYLLGFNQYSVLLSLSARHSGKVGAVRHFLATAPQTVFVSEGGGQYRFGVSLLARSPLGVDHFLSEFQEQHGRIIFEKQVTSHLSLADYRVDYLYKKKVEPAALTWGGKRDELKIDELDHYILRGLCSGKFESLSLFARQLEVPSSTLEHRIRALEEKKIIVGYRYLVDTQKLGAQRLWMSITMKGTSEHLTKQFFEFCENHPYVRFATRALGSWDFDIGIDGVDGNSQAQVVQSIYDTFQEHVASITTVPIFKFLKVCSYPFWEHPTEYR
jgi:DNA-binding Lrp family transcriptional regulator